MPSPSTQRVTVTVAALTAAFLAACGKSPVTEGSDAGDSGGVGSVRVGGTVVNCPTVSELGISPAELDFSGSGVASLSATASLPVPETPSYSWSATSGIIANPSASMTTFQCTGPGVVTLTLTASFKGCSDSAEGVVTCLGLDANAPD